MSGSGISVSSLLGLVGPEQRADHSTAGSIGGSLLTTQDTEILRGWSNLMSENAHQNSLKIL